MNNKITIRPEQPEDFKAISKLVYESFHYGTPTSDGSLEEKLVREIRSKKYYIPELSFVAVMDGELVGYFMLSHFPISGEHSEIQLPSPECLMALELCKDGLANIKGEVTYRMYETLS